MIESGGGSTLPRHVMNVPISSLVLALAWSTNHQVALKVVVACSAQCLLSKRSQGLQWSVCNGSGRERLTDAGHEATPRE